jgi:hypothetical protein
VIRLAEGSRPEEEIRHPEGEEGAPGGRPEEETRHPEGAEEAEEGQEVRPEEGAGGQEVRPEEAEEAREVRPEGEEAGQEVRPGEGPEDWEAEGGAEGGVGVEEEEGVHSRLRRFLRRCHCRHRCRHLNRHPNRHPNRHRRGGTSPCARPRWARVSGGSIHRSKPRTSKRGSATCSGRYTSGPKEGEEGGEAALAPQAPPRDLPAVCCRPPLGRTRRQRGPGRGPHP